MENRDQLGAFPPPSNTMNRRKAKFSRPVKVNQMKAESPSYEEDQCGREEWVPPATHGKYCINPADAPITPPLTPPCHGATSGKPAPEATTAPATPQERGAYHAPTVQLPASSVLPPLPPPSVPANEHAHTAHMLLTAPPPPPPSIPPPPPPPPPPAPSRQLNRLPPPPGTRYGPPTAVPTASDLSTRAHPLSLEDRQQQRSRTSDTPLPPSAPPPYPAPPPKCSVRVPSPQARNSRERSPPREQRTGAPSSLPYNFRADFSVPPPPVSQTQSVPLHLLPLLGRTASGHITDNVQLNFCTPNVSQSNIPYSREQKQIVPPTYKPETRASQLNNMPPFHLTPSAVSQPHTPVHNYPPPREPRASSSHTLVNLHHLTQTKVPKHEPPPQIPQHMSTHHSSHSYIPTYQSYPTINPLLHVPLTDVPPTHGKSPHKAQQGKSHSRSVTEHSTAPYQRQFQQCEPPFTNREGSRRSSRDTHKEEYSPWYRMEEREAPNVTNGLPNLLNPWVPPPFQTPSSRPPPLPPPPPQPKLCVETSNQSPLSHLLAMPTPPPEQHDVALSPGSGNLYSNHGHSSQNYQGHQQYWNQQKTSSPLAEYQQPHHTDTRRSYDTMASRWSQDVPHRVVTYQVPTILNPRMDDDYRLSHHGHGAYTRGRGSRRGRTTTFPRPWHRQLTEVTLNTESSDLTVHRQCDSDKNQPVVEADHYARALFSAIAAARITMGGAAAPDEGITEPAGVSPTGTPALPALPALPAPQVPPVLVAAPWPSTAAASASQEDNEEGSVEQRPCVHTRKNDEPTIDVSNQLTRHFSNPAIQNDDLAAAMAAKYPEFYKSYMQGSFGDALCAHHGQPSLCATPKDPQTSLLHSTGQEMDVATRKINTGLLSCSGRLMLPDPHPSVAPFLALETSPEVKEEFMRLFWESVRQQHALMMTLALNDLNHQILLRGKQESEMALAVLPPGPSIHSSKADAAPTYGSALAQYSHSGTFATSSSHQSDFLRSALQHSSAQTPALPACSSSGCCSNENCKTTKKEQRQKELEQLKLFQIQQLQRKIAGERLRQVNDETLRRMNEETIRQINEQLQQQQQKKIEEDKMKQLNEELQKQAIQAHIEQQQQQQQQQHTRQKKKTLKQLQTQREKVYALKDAHYVSFLQQHVNEDGMIRENQHLETKPHLDVDLQLTNAKAKKGRKRKSELLEPESTVKWAINHEGHRSSQNSLAGGLQKGVIVHGMEYVNQMPEFTYQQQLQSVNSGIMKDSLRELSKQGKQKQQQKMPQLTQLLTQGQSEIEIHQMANAQKLKETLRASKLPAEQIITKDRQRKQSEMPYNTQNKNTNLQVQNLFTDLHVQQKISEYIKQEPIYSPAETTVIKPKQEQEDDIWNVTTVKVEQDLEQEQLGVDLQRKSFSFSHHAAAASTQLADGSQSLDLSSKRHVQKLECDKITIKTEEDAEEICGQTTNQQAQETYELLEELDEIKLDTLQQQNTEQQQSLLELPSFGSYLNVDGMEEADVEEADLNAAYHAVVSLQQSEIPDVPATPPSHMTRTSEYCQSQLNGSAVSNLSRTTKQLDEDCCSSKVLQQVSVIQLPQRNPSPVSVQIKTDADIKGPKVQHKTQRRSRKLFEKEGTVPARGSTHSSKSDGAHDVMPSSSHGQSVSFYKSAYKHTNTMSGAMTNAPEATVSADANTTNASLTAAANRNSRAAVRKATHGITPTPSWTASDKVVTSSDTQAILQHVSSDSTNATAFQTSDTASPSLQVSQTRKGVKRKYSTRQSKK